ncbi:hypothetical protein VZT92_015035 [Zoarces viviparus]|uniref:Uncharacterized protein n=1 Tax=Zoarces viviparus TaxID=48416 RepID=A0AAW1EVT5_ZOAVI
MHKALGQRDAIVPLNVIATAEDSDVAEEPDEEPSTSAAGPSFPNLSGSKRPKSKRRQNEVLEYLQDYTERQEKRQRELDEREGGKKQEQLDTLIGIFELVEKQ